MATISLKGIDKAAVLAALYNASRPLGMGFLSYSATPMTKEEAGALLQGQTYFDYLKGRVMKVNLSSDELDTQFYDRDNGQGAAEEALAGVLCQDVNTPEIQARHAIGKEDAARSAEQQMKVSSIYSEGTLRLGLSDVADILKPAVDKALE